MSAMHTMRRIGHRAAVATPSPSPEFPSQGTRFRSRRLHRPSAPPRTSGYPRAASRSWSTPCGRRAAPSPSHSIATRRFSGRPKLAYEWVVDGKVVPPSEVAENEDGDEASDDKEVIVFLHGLLGNAKNLRTPAKKLTRQLPQVKALLIDVRGHGNSSSFARPHDFQSCVEDVVDTLSPLGLRGPRSPTAICGHSLGGRIALQYSHHLCANRSNSGDGEAVEPPRQTWILDSVPGRADPMVHDVLRAVSSMPTPVPSKAWLVETLTSEHGMDKGVAAWMATNLRDRGDKSFEWIFDLGVANELVENFSDQNFSRMIGDVTGKLNDEDRADGRRPAAVHLVMAGRSKGWTEEIVSELRSVPSFDESSPSSSFQMHTLEEAGHWVHVDDLEGLLKLMTNGYAMVDHNRRFG